MAKDITNIIIGFENAIKGRVPIILKYETKMHILNVLYSSKSKINLLNFKNIRYNTYYIETLSKNNTKFSCINHGAYSQRQALEKLFTS